jgi:ABC-2 type transport system ATP-binding protein
MIEAHGLVKRYGSTTAVNDLSFSIRPGLVTGFLGPNGAGKTTTMRMILGLDAPTQGSVTVDGRSYRDLPAPMLATLAIAVLAVLCVSSEYSSGMISTSLTAVPKRGRVLAAKSLVFAAVTSVVGEVTSFTAFFAGQALISGHAPTRRWPIPGWPGRWWERGWP